jgi:FAD/FMN-containing dehydrogenase
MHRGAAWTGGAAVAQNARLSILADISSMSDKSVVERLRRVLGDDCVAIGAEIGAKHSVDFSGEHACAPAALVRPRSTDDVASIMRICSEAGQPVVVQGGLTGLAGGATPRRGEIAISLERMRGIEQIDPASMTATVLAGTPLQTLQEAAGDAGFLFPLDLGARGSCTVGGNIATNAGGNQVIRFGMTRNLVLGLEAVLADGTVVSSMNMMLKNNAGYDLKQLFIGTEGTLGIVTRAVLRLYPKLPVKTAALCAVAGFDEAVALLGAMRRDLAGSLSAFEAMWASYFHYVTDHVAGLRSPLEARHPLYVLIETEGREEVADRERIERALESALESGIVADAVVAQSERERRSFWSMRDGIAEITPGLQPMLAFDVSMPIGAMPAFLARVDRELGTTFPSVTNLVFGHLGDNNLHLAIGTGREEDLPKVCGIVYGATGDCGGSISAEHGIGVLKREYLELSRSREEIELMRRLKAALDPHGVLNPGRVVDARG